MKRSRRNLLGALSTTLLVVIIALIFWPVTIGLDSAARRKAAAGRVQKLISAIESTSGRAPELDELRSIALSDYSFGATYATASIGDLGQKAKPLVPTLGDLLFSADPYVAREAALSLAELGPIAESQLPKLVRAIDAPDFSARYAAYAAVGEIGERAIPLLPMLRNRLKTETGELTASALRRAINKLEALQRQLRG